MYSTFWFKALQWFRSYRVHKISGFQKMLRVTLTFKPVTLTFEPVTLIFEPVALTFEPVTDL